MNRFSTLIITLFALCSFSSAALDLQTAKQQGLIGEMPSGYLGVVKPSAETKALVAEINHKRQAVYLKIAKKNQLSLAQVAELAGQKALQKTPQGQFIQTASGQWMRKP